MIDIKNTLNLPDTGFPMRANLVSREPERISAWQNTELYQKLQSKNKDAPSFILHDGPPFTNGDVHIGTALNKVLKDCILRYKGMKGFRSPFIPGWDCHGLPIEHKVMQALGKKESHPPLAVRQACGEFSKDYIVKQTQQFERLGILADWKNAYRTMDPSYEAGILRVLASFVKKGLVYKSKKPVYWSIPCETALAEGEIEYKDHTSPSVFVRFNLTPEATQTLGLKNENAYCVVWTTTPWTLPANLAICVHPDLEYVALESNGCTYIVAQALAQSFQKICGISSSSLDQSFTGKQLEGLLTKHPFIDRPSPILLATYVTTDAGTGCVHTAPGHGLDDYLTGLKYNLEIYSPINDQGCYIDDGKIPSSLIGASILPSKDKPLANTIVIDLLKEKGALLKKEDHLHSYPHCWRSKTPVIFRATDQWFIALDKDGLRQEVLNSISKVNWIPQWGEKRIRGSVEARPDWCISRQRSWGVPLPVFYDEANNPLLDPLIIEALAQKIEKDGTDSWFSKTAEELLTGIPLPPPFANKKLTKGTDTLDVWIDSGSSHESVLKKHSHLSFPADLYLEGSDQHRGWFQSSLWTSTVMNGTPPFKSIITHGFVVDENKKKISKSDNKPQTADGYVKQFGADIIRLWICSEDYKNDVPISEDIVNHVVQTYRTIRNTFRFQLGNLFDFTQKDLTPPSTWTYLEKWVIHELNLLIDSVSKAYDQYEFHKVYQSINRFCSVTLSATYHDILKDRLYTYGPNWPERRSAQSAIYHIFSVLARLLSPILAFTTDEAWSYFHNNTDFCENPILLESFPETTSNWHFPSQHEEVESLLKFKEQINEKMEKARQSKVLGQSLDAKVSIHINFNSPIGLLLKKYEDKLPELFIVSQVILLPNDLLAVEVEPAEGFRCPRSWRWVPQLVNCEGFGLVSPRCQEALLSKYTTPPLDHHERSKTQKT